MAFVLLRNAHSLANQISGFHSFLHIHKFNTIAITETWLHDFICTNELIAINYTIYYKYHTSRGGGLCLQLTVLFFLNC